ncbi:MAG: PrpF domain-containing protein [Burkholderiaceae bacterium]
MDRLSVPAAAARGSRDSPSTIPAVLMRGGRRKGVFFLAADLPIHVDRRDALLLRVLGSPDRFGGQLDGVGGATSATSRIVILSPSLRDDCDVDVLVGAVAIDEARIDFSVQCSHLLAAVGPAAIAAGLVAPADGLCRVRIWHPARGQRIDAFVPVREGQVVEEGCFEEDGVPFAGAEIRLELRPPAGGRCALVEPDEARGRDDDRVVASLPLLPTARVQETLDVPGLGAIAATLIGGACPTVFVRASALRMTGREKPAALARKGAQIERLEAVRAAAAVRIGLVDDAAQAALRSPRVPVLVWVDRPAAYRATTGVDVPAERIDLLARLFVGGRVDAAMPVDVSIALAAAAALPGSLVNELVRVLPSLATRIGHAAGVLAVGAEVSSPDGQWRLDKAVLSRTARRLMSGVVHVPPATIRGCP